MSSSYESTSYFSEMKTPNEGFLSRENTPPVTPRSYDQPPLHVVIALFRLLIALSPQDEFLEQNNNIL